MYVYLELNLRVNLLATISGAWTGETDKNEVMAKWPYLQSILLIFSINKKLIMLNEY